jgi:hypothetical protein
MRNNLYFAAFLQALLSNGAIMPNFSVEMLTGNSSPTVVEVLLMRLSG